MFHPQPYPRALRKSASLTLHLELIVNKAKKVLQNVIRRTKLSPKPVFKPNMAEFGAMQKMMIRVQDRAREIRSLQEKVPKLKTQFAETKGIFRGRERKEP